MKKIIMIMMMGAMLSMPVMAQNHRGDSWRGSEKKYEHRQKPYNDAYIIGRNDVLYNNKRIKGVHTHSFKDLGRGYAKDAFSVYYRGKKTDAAVKSFRVLKNGYAKDAFSVYYKGKKIKEASPLKFRVLKDGYAEDAFNTYYKGKRVR